MKEDESKAFNEFSRIWDNEMAKEEIKDKIIAVLKPLVTKTNELDWKIDFINLPKIITGLVQLFQSELSKTPQLFPNKLYSIKPLEWEKCGQDYLGGISGLADYEISRTRNTKWALGIGYNSDREDFDKYILCDSLDEAKSKAQEDWNNRISQYLTEYKETSSEQ